MSRFLWKTKVHYRIHNSPLPIIMYHIDPVHANIPLPEDICAWVFQMVSFSQVLSAESCLHFPSLSFVQHALKIQREKNSVCLINEKFLD
jgi:hypothetical protein